ncbi:hypothetical protein CVT25_010388 [Psilocybe cyanescens]|uniref:Uncharacterized protein n=1 Tax=Psilocybe cyanescens TaxID=93625 RepID=A0A409XP25_PSICY|nr:hypothetical protein CVT25_010388 [Psilocybe cyanescens]
MVSADRTIIDDDVCDQTHISAHISGNEMARGTPCPQRDSIPLYKKSFSMPFQISVSLATEQMRRTFFTSKRALPLSFPSFLDFVTIFGSSTSTSISSAIVAKEKVKSATGKVETKGGGCGTSGNLVLDATHNEKLYLAQTVAANMS